MRTRPAAVFAAAAIALSLAACGSPDDTDAPAGTNPPAVQSPRAPVAEPPPPPQEAPPAIVAAIPAECNELPVIAEDIVTIMNTTITNASYARGFTLGADMQSCYYTTTDTRLGGTPQDKRVVGVHLIYDEDGTSDWYGELLPGEGNREPIALGDEGYTNTGTSDGPAIHFRSGSYIVGIEFLAKPQGSPETHALTAELAAIAASRM